MGDILNAQMPPTMVEILNAQMPPTMVEILNARKDNTKCKVRTLRYNGICSPPHKKRQTRKRSGMVVGTPNGRDPQRAKTQHKIKTQTLYYNEYVRPHNGKGALAPQSKTSQTHNMTPHTERGFTHTERGFKGALAPQSKTSPTHNITQHTPKEDLKARLRLYIMHNAKPSSIRIKLLRV